MSIKIGCCGFQEARSKYYDEFRLVEIQQTFYQPPPVGTAFKWRSQAPADFEFSIKAWQLITHEGGNSSYRNLREKLSARALASCGHFKPTRMVFDAWRRTEAIAEALNARIIIFQTSKSFRPTHINIKNVRNFFRRINRRKYLFVWEPNSKWPIETIQELCQELNLIYTAEPYNENAQNFGPIRYYRLRGKSGFRSRYEKADFEKFIQMDLNSTPCYFVFNNASMLFDARNFLNLVKQRELEKQSEGAPEPTSITGEKEGIEGNGELIDSGSLEPDADMPETANEADDSTPPLESEIKTSTKEPADSQPAEKEAEEKSNAGVD